LKVSINVKIAVQCFENIWGANASPWLRAWMRLQFAHVRSFDCRGRLQNKLANCSAVGLCCVTITRH